MSNSKVIIHIGLHKTGTTFLQWILNRNSKLLADRGLFVAQTANVGGAHHNIGYELLEKDRFNASAGTVAQLRMEVLEAPGTYIISSEELEFLNIEAIGKLVEALHPIDVSVVCLIRPQDELIPRTYGQQIRMGASFDSFGSYFEQSLLQPRFDFLNLISSWRSIFRDVNVSFYGSGQPGLVEKFFDLVGMPCPENLVQPDSRLNVSYSALTIEGLKRLNAHLKCESNLRTRERFNVIRQIEHNPDWRPLEGPALTVSSSMRGVLRARYARSNSILAASFGADPETMDQYRFIFQLEGAASEPIYGDELEAFCQDLIERSQEILSITRKEGRA